MVVDTKLYDIVGVKPDADERDIRKAFMKKARELHPDKNKDDPNATEKFQELNEAYEILKNPQKRERYDRFGTTDTNEDIFNPFPHPRQRRQRTENIVHKINVTLEDLYNGKEIKLRINRNIICPDCNGNGCQKGKSPKKCPECGGSGQKVFIRRMGPMITQQVTTCPSCHGLGEQIDNADKCHKCRGKKVVEEKKTIDVHIEPGMEDGDRIPFIGCADESPGADTGDVIIVLKLMKNDCFVRKHDDLLIEKTITLSEALLGTTFVVNHLDGRKIVVSTPKNSVIVPDSVKVIEREGMPQRGNQFEKGKLFIKFKVIFPKSEELNQSFIDQLKKCLPLPDETKGIDMNAENVFSVEMKDSNISQFQNSQSSYHSNRDEAYSTYSDDEEQRGTSAQCNPM